ncbi:MAG TPA: hypothetical protein VLT16_12490, partial [Candidatus Limnocylindrales bacterium]|nr:hypothetical protein [Candidatus Limnocylindrales bacterium]
ELEKQLPPLLEKWEQLRDKDLPALNHQLKGAGMPELTVGAVEPQSHAVVSARDKDEEERA